MELKDLEKLMKVFEESDSREFKLDDGDFHLYLSKNKHHAPVEAPVQAAPAPAAAPAEPQAPAPVAKEAPGVSVKAPLVRSGNMGSRYTTSGAASSPRSTSSAV